MNLNLNTVADSSTVLINSLAQQLQAQGIKIYNFSVGEPKLPLHPIIKDAAIMAMQQNHIYYPPVAGLPELRKSACQWLNQTYHCSYQTSQCLVTNGAKLGLYLLLQTLLNPGDEVLIPAPYWVSYPAIVELFQGKAKIIRSSAENGWKITAADLAKTVTEKTRIVILNNGANPTGTLYSRTEVAELLAFAKQQQLWVIADEVYSGLVYDQNEYTSCGAFRDHHDQVVVLQSCSKNFGMTGWRVGFVFAPEQLIRPLTTLVGQSTSGVTTISQWAAIAALQHHDAITYSLQQAMQKQRQQLLDAFEQHFKIKLPPPPSALYAFISLQQLGIEGLSAPEFCQRALQEAHVALVPGDAFGQENYVRLSFGDGQDLEAGIKMLGDFCKELGFH